MKFELPPLPYAKDALAPHMSAETLTCHHDKHFKTYIEKTNALVEKQGVTASSLEALVRGAGSEELFNNAAQAWNHDFFFKCMAPDAGGKPDGAVATAIDRDFGGYAAFREKFHAAAAKHFGSGWAWLVQADGKLKIVTTGNADTPLADGHAPLLVCDVWEHAYYIDYRNERPKFLDAFLDHLVNWRFVNAEYGKAGTKKAA